MTREEKAKQCRPGNNCCQTVLLTYADRMGMTPEQLRQLGSAFGLGMGGMKGTCGALVGAVAAASMMSPQGMPTGGIARTIVDEFEQMCGATICGDIKGVTTGKVLCSCDNCILNAVKIVERHFGGEEA
ncbi:MAG: C-GCAxxG-C-C family protein [Lachnospiraceae bacterium]|jgi:C_GCAxxG_C_C family probable redox protein